MDQNKDSGSQQKQDTSPAPSGGGGDRIPTSPDVCQYDQEPEDQSDSEQHGNKFTRFNKWLAHLWSRDPDRQLELILSGAITFFALCQLAVTILNNRSTSNQVDKIIGAANSIKDSASQIKTAGWVFSGAAQGINNAGWNAVGKLQMQADQVGRSADAAHDAVGATKEQMRLDQRAWLGAGDAKFTFVEEKPFQVTVYLKDIGKTPAVDARSEFDLTVLPKDHALQMSDLDYRYTHRKLIMSGTVFPTATMPLNRTGADNLPKGGLGPLKDGTQIFYAYGTILYNDVFGREHWTHFCYAMHKDLITAEMCTIYNDTDDKKGAKP